MMNDDATWLDDWGDAQTLCNCARCDWTYLAAAVPDRCPYCGHAPLTPLHETADRPVYTQPPELVVPFSVDNTTLNEALTRFVRRAWFRPDDLTQLNLRARLQQVYLPIWLVDTAVSAQWEAEIGVDYEVVSHRERFKDNQWQTQRYTETKVRWEPRLGTLTRRYDNVRAPALEEQRKLEHSLGAFELEAGRPFQPEDVARTLVRLPNRAPQDAWPDAELALQKAAAADCHQATQADHIRAFRWSAQFDDRHWTQLLTPLYATYYTGDDGRTYPVFLHGQTGKLAGLARASLRKARRWALGIGIAAGGVLMVGLLLLLLSLLLAQDALLPVGSGVVTAAFLLGAAALLPLLLAWYRNHAQFIAAGRELMQGMLAMSYELGKERPSPAQVVRDEELEARKP